MDQSEILSSGCEQTATLMNSQLPPPAEELWTVGGFYGRESWFYLVMWPPYIVCGLVDGHTPMSI